MEPYFPEYFYSLNEYTYKWGWNLKLKDDEKINIGNNVDAFYSVYLYLQSGTKYKRMYNYLDETTIPSSDLPTETFITVDEWNEDFGYVYNCLMKVLLYKLGLN
jgi:hypothetical protein